MAKTASKSTSGALPATVFEATLGGKGDVVKGAEITEPQAIAERKAGRDVVVCGDDLTANRDLAKRIEQKANGSYRRCPPHASAGPNALPHYQPNPRGPQGHTFYETPNRKAK